MVGPGAELGPVGAVGAHGCVWRASGVPQDPQSPATRRRRGLVCRTQEAEKGGLLDRMRYSLGALARGGSSESCSRRSSPGGGAPVEGLAFRWEEESPVAG